MKFLSLASTSGHVGLLRNLVLTGTALMNRFLLALISGVVISIWFARRRNDGL